MSKNSQSKISIPTTGTDGQPAEPLEIDVQSWAMADASAVDLTQTSAAGSEPSTGVTATADPCCGIPIIAAGLASGMHLQNHFTIETPQPYAPPFKFKIRFFINQAKWNILQAYLDYMVALHPCVTGLGTAWSLSQENFGSGHTSRRVTRDFWAGLAPGGNGAVTVFSNPPHTPANPMWGEYYAVAQPDNNTPPPSAANALSFNQTYAISTGIWLDTKGDCNLPNTPGCRASSSFTNFRFQTSSGPL